MSLLAEPGLVPAIVRNGMRHAVGTRAQPGHTVVPTGRAAPIDPERILAPNRLEIIRQSYDQHRFPDAVVELLVSGTRAASHAAYQSSWKAWSDWCRGRDRDPMSNSLDSILSFLADCSSSGSAYRSINVHRSMFSSTLPQVEGFDIGKHPLVTRLMRGIFNTRPPAAKYTSMWDVNVVLRYLTEHMSRNDSLRIIQLSAKTAILLALTTMMRISELASIDAGSIRFSTEGVAFSLLNLRKSQRSGSLHGFSVKCLPSGPSATAFCPVQTLRSYLEATENRRTDAESRGRLFISTVRPFGAVTSSTVGNWMKDILREAGVDTCSFSAHSTRGAAASKAAAVGIPVMSILRLASWSSESTFTTFYRREIQQQDVGAAVLLRATETERDSA